MTKIAIIGAGAFGTALAVVLARARREVVLLARAASRAAEIRRSRENSSRLPGIALPRSVEVTADPAAFLAADAVLVAVPAQKSATVIAKLAPFLPPDAPLVACAKGIERESGHTQTAIFSDRVPGAAVAALSGPGFAAEIAAGLPTAMTVGADSQALAARLCVQLSTDTFRLYASTDLPGIEIGGAVKNVIAIASGVVAARRLGESARAALICRGLAEMTRFGVAAGARAETFAGLSGLGDLLLTATSDASRNTRFGIALAGGQTMTDLLAPERPLAEGAYTAGIVARQASRRGIDMPITQAVAAVIAGALTIDEAIAGLITRPLRAE